MDGFVMSDKVRCPSCRGAKKVPKLGGMIGDCNTCGGKGLVCENNDFVRHIASDEIVIEPASVVSAVASVVAVDEPVSVDVKVDGKKAIYKRKKSA